MRAVGLNIISIIKKHHLETNKLEGKYCQGSRVRLHTLLFGISHEVVNLNAGNHKGKEGLRKGLPISGELHLP